MKGGGAPEIAANAFSGNSGYAVNYSASAGQTGEINIHGNQAEGCGINVYSVSAPEVAGKNLSGNTVTGCSGAGISVAAADIPDGVTENTVSGGVIYVRGTVNHFITWNDGGTPIEGDDYGITVPAGKTLTITKGVALQNMRFTVTGTLKAEGSAEEPVLFTGKNKAAPGEWRGIKFEPGSGGSVLDHVEVAYGGRYSGTTAEIEIKWLLAPHRQFHDC